ncbi:hypothetical protein BDZ97DRAFT_56842 [Flammula alnicola]|nr:hypothetical protein BDZ97DRAFT_56842 [Flammula alnicola]
MRLSFQITLGCQLLLCAENAFIRPIPTRSNIFSRSFLLSFTEGLKEMRRTLSFKPEAASRRNRAPNPCPYDAHAAPIGGDSAKIAVLLSRPLTTLFKATVRVAELCNRSSQ